MDGSVLRLSRSAIWFSLPPEGLPPSSARIRSTSSFRPASAMCSTTSEGLRIVQEIRHVTIHIKLPNGSVYPHPGLTNFLDVQVDPNTDTVAVRAQVPNPGRPSDPGRGRRRQHGAGCAAIGAGHSASRGPARSGGPLRPGGRRAKKVEQRRITTSVEQGRDIVVTAGLKEGELVIVEGVQKVRPGQVVTASTVAQN